tara:strand:- start:15468 stop:15866 length:399 start_codon:yes stop_codon:yes gene_type:complete
MTQEYDFSELVRASRQYKSDKDAKYKDSSRDRLSKIAKKKIETTMIGALSSVEKNLGFLWGHEEQRDLTPEEQHVKNIYDQIRSEILDKGNNQIRNLEAELAQYEVTWLRYHMTLPIAGTANEEDKNGEAEE